MVISVTLSQDLVAIVETTLNLTTHVQRSLIKTRFSTAHICRNVQNARNLTRATQKMATNATNT